MGMISDGDGVKQYQNIVEVGVHSCTDEDYAELHAPNAKSKGIIDSLTGSKSLFCFDKTDVNGAEIDYGFWGAEDNRDHRRIEVIYMPCATYKHMT